MPAEEQGSGSGGQLPGDEGRFTRSYVGQVVYQVADHVAREGQFPFRQRRGAGDQQRARLFLELISPAVAVVENKSFAHHPRGRCHPPNGVLLREVTVRGQRLDEHLNRPAVGVEGGTVDGVIIGDDNHDVEIGGRGRFAAHDTAGHERGKAVGKVALDEVAGGINGCWARHGTFLSYMRQGKKGIQGKEGKGREGLVGRRSAGCDIGHPLLGVVEVDAIPGGKRFGVDEASLHEEQQHFLGFVAAVGQADHLQRAAFQVDDVESVDGGAFVGVPESLAQVEKGPIAPQPAVVAEPPVAVALVDAVVVRAGGEIECRLQDHAAYEKEQHQR